MKIDFSPVQNGEIKLIDFASRYTVAELKAATNASLDWITNVIKDMSDADITFNPVDPEANDPYAVAGEENIGWSLAHLVVHATASSEEWARYSAILAAGIPYPAEPRLRYETNWHTVTTQAQCIQRLEESRRIRLALLDAWPNTPDLETKRAMSERFIERVGEVNAPAAFLFGLRHEYGHYDQFTEVARQVAEAQAHA